MSYGLDAAVGLVREFVDRQADRVLRSRKLPDLYFTGPHGIGKTTLLETLRSKLHGNIPYARLDCAEDQNLTTQDIVTKLALGLNRKCGMYGRLAFPRFATGLIAMRTTVGDIPGEAHRDMTAALAQARRINWIKQILGDLGDAAADLPFGTRFPGTKILARLLPSLLIGLLLRFSPARKVLLGRGTAWYGQGNTDPVDTLVTLNQWAKTPNVDRTRIDQLLLAAFLADLRQAFGRGGRTARRPLNCVVLLDNADAEPGAEFLRQLTEVRNGAEPDPMTLVATALPDGGDEPLSLDDPRLPPRGPIEPWLNRVRLPVWLPDLAEPHVREMTTANLRFPGMRPPPYVPRIVYQFTRGHPESTAILTGRLRDDRPLSLSDVLDDAVTKHLRDRLLGGFPSAYVGVLTTCAAARDVGEINRLDGLLDDADLELIRDHWSLLHKSGDASIMQPVLRHLLLRDLAARRDDAEDGWRNVFSWLRERTGGDEYAPHYHALALGEVEPVARWLNDRLGYPAERPEHLDAGPWLAALQAITAAPVRNPPARSPHDLVDTAWAGRWNSQPARVAYLVTGLHLAGDPLTGDRETLHEEIAGAYLGLRKAAPSGREVFGREATRHQKLAKEWSSATDGQR